MRMEMLMNMPAMLLLTIGAYLLGLWVKKKSRIALLHPFLIMQHKHLPQAYVHP